jgi:hypothetical protein
MTLGFQGLEVLKVQMGNGGNYHWSEWESREIDKSSTRVNKGTTETHIPRDVNTPQRYAVHTEWLDVVYVDGWTPGTRHVAACLFLAIKVCIIKYN